MTYREILRKYKQGVLPQEEAAQVSTDIEKQEAISEYLADAAEEIALELPGELTLPEKEAADFAKMIRKTIRLAFLKLGIVVLILAISATLFVQYSLPGIISSRYYNPGEIIGTTPGGNEFNRISRDMAVFTELTLPGYYRQHVTVYDRGYGEYDINIPQDVSFNGDFTQVSGKIEKGKLVLYNANLFSSPSGNVFYWFDARNAAAEKNVNDYFNTQKPLSELLPKEVTERHQELEADEIASMDEDEKYIAYVTLDKQMPYEDFIAWIDKTPDIGTVWCVPRTSDDLYPDNLGFYYDPYASTDLIWDKEKYPNLFIWESNKGPSEEDMKTESYMKTHFISLLRYMQDQTDFRKALQARNSFNVRSDGYGEIADYIEKNGLTIYGFAVMTDKKGAEKILQKDNVYSMQVTKLI